MSYNDYNNGIPTLKDAMESTRLFIEREQAKRTEYQQKMNQQAKQKSSTDMSLGLFFIVLVAAIGFILVCIGAYKEKEPNREDIDDEDRRLSMYRPSRPHDFVISSPIRSIENQNRRTHTESPARVSYRDESRNEHRPHVAQYIQPSAPVMNYLVSDRQAWNYSIVATTSRQIQPAANDLPPTYQECVGFVIH